MIRLGGVLTLLAVIVYLYAAFDALTAPAERVRNLPKAIWMIIVLLLPEIGAFCWFMWGRPRAAVGARSRLSPFSWQNHGTAPGAKARPLAPDDDPEFLRRLSENLRNPPHDEDPPG